MKLFSIETPRFRVDGGAMFGVVPKIMWSRYHKADENNMVELACRALLIDDGQNRILVDTGLGDKMNFEEMKHYAADSRFSLINSLKSAGYKPEDISHVINTHYHFDHCGGNTCFDNNGNTVPAFKNAQYYISKKQFHSASEPNRREKPSFLTENFLPVQEAGKLTLLEQENSITDNVSVRFFDGHTAGLMAVSVNYHGKKLIFTGDMLPAAAFVPLSWISAYDIAPLTALNEKQAFLEEAVLNDYTLFLQHDEHHECASLKKTEKGIRIENTFSLQEWLNN